MRRLLREPLVHFLLLGAAVFAVYHFMKAPRRQSYKEMRDKYTVLLPAPPEDGAPAPGTGAVPVPSNPTPGPADVVPE